MSYSTVSLTTFPIPLGIQAHQQAQRFRDHHSQFEKSKQVYLNTLAVLAVKDYLAMMGYDSNLAQSYSWQPVQQTLMDCADLMVQDYGRIECRYCIEGDTELRIPPEVWDDRLGFIFVQFSPSLREAQVLGLASSVAQQHLPLDAIEPLEELTDVLQGAHSSSIARETSRVVTQLQSWMQNVQDSWQTVQHSLDFFLSSSELTPSYRSSAAADDTLSPDLCRSKVVTLEHPQGPLALSVCLGLKAIPSAATEVWVKVNSTQAGRSLPTQLKMSILTPDESEVMVAQSNGTEAMQFRFSAHSGEQFRLQIDLDHFTWHEDFVL